DLSVELVLFVHIFFFSRSVPHRDLHSFPTRRSSDLQGRRQFLRAAVLAREVATRGGERRLDALLLVGESALAGGSVRDAEAGYAGALAEAPPGSPEWQRAVAGLLLVGERYFKGSGLEDAGRVYQLVERTVPGGAEGQFRALAGIGLVAEARGDAEEARRRYQEIARGASDRDLVR